MNESMGKCKAASSHELRREGKCTGVRCDGNGGAECHGEEGEEGEDGWSVHFLFLFLFVFFGEGGRGVIDGV